ncbi:MAG: hypothetical protein PHD32_08560 [Eubacteriales bacterium]|nr:hypothetical protein [Eubacteriales bacterium]
MNELDEDNRRLREIEQRMRRFAADVIAITRDEERLTMKMRVYDDLGRSLIATRQLLKQGASSRSFDLTVWKNAVQMLKRDNDAAQSGDLVLALHSTIDGETSCKTDGQTELAATADIPENMAVAYWEVNGEPYYENMENTFTFTPVGNTVVDARLRPAHKVTTINAQMQFLDAKDKPKGDPFAEFVFEEDYQNPATGEMLPGGSITVSVKAVVPNSSAGKFGSVGIKMGNIV